MNSYFSAIKYLQLLILLFPFVCIGQDKSPDTIVVVPLGGNTWCSEDNEENHLISEEGIVNWTSNKQIFQTYIRVNTTGSFRIQLKAKTDIESIIGLSVHGKTRKINVKGNDLKTYDAGTWLLQDTGYIKITMTGIAKKGKYFADVSSYSINGTTVNSNTCFVKNNDDNYFYWGRRGPSVHLNFPFADTVKAEWFYNEITVPEKQDVIGSYFMANGFGEGYFGIQVNSATERRVLFSVWSPYSTDDPKSIPDSMKITLLKKGTDVNTGEFGNEGSGGQSFLRYNWKAGNTYKFLLHGKPDDNGNSIYTAYFFAPEKNQWMLIASFKRPQTNTYLKRLHSFLENFIPEKGDKTREVLFSNQWICDMNGKWLPLLNGQFTYDNTAAKQFRKDYQGGVKDGKFYLKNCGFFNNYTAYKKLFTRSSTNNHPVIDWKGLP